MSSVPIEPASSVIQPPALPGAAKRRPWLALLLLSGVVAGLAYVYFVDPTSSRSLPCAFYEMSGFHCPGCGSTRAAHALVHGRVIAAIGYNPLAAVVVPVIAIRALVLLLRPRPQTRMMSATWVYTIFGLIVAYGILRNIPAWPFTLLAP
jgi:hypothetical protein